MAHTPRRAKEKRPHPYLHPIGAVVGIRLSTGEVQGTVSRHDEGGWIYVDWKSSGYGLSHFLRSSQVYAIKENQNV